MEEKKDDLQNVENVEVEPLSDDALDSVSGGETTDVCSWDDCSNAAMDAI